MISILLSCLVLLEAVQGLTVIAPPTNVTANAGTDATIPCLVTNLQLGEEVNWKLGNGTVLAAKAVVTNANKYRVDGTFNLTILRVDSNDNGPYICVAATNTLTGYLTVNAGHIAAYSGTLTAILMYMAMLVTRE